MDITEIYDLLYRLGLTANYTGFFHTSCAVWLVLRQPQRLRLVTKWLYPEVAKRYRTNWKAVERNIRTVISVVWERCPELLGRMAGTRLDKRPRPAQFLSILAAYLRYGIAA